LCFGRGGKERVREREAGGGVVGKREPLRRKLPSKLRVKGLGFSIINKCALRELELLPQ
jgi:hypothetical protein